MKVINFVSGRQKSLNKKQLTDRKFFYISTAIFSVLVLVAIIILTTQWFVFSNLKEIKTESDALQAQILSGEKKENAFIVLVHKLGAIATVIEERQKRQDAVDYFSSVFGNEVLIEEMRYEEDQQKQLLMFKLVSKDVFILEGVLDKMQSQELKNLYQEVKVSGLDRSERASYGLDVMVPLSRG